LLLPYLDQAPFYSQWDLTLEYYQQPAATRQTSMPIYFCPTRRSAGMNVMSVGDIPELGWTAQDFPGALGDYGCCEGDNDNGQYNTDQADGAMILADYTNTTNPNGGYFITRWRSRIKVASIVDGLSNTLLVGEKHVIQGKFGTQTGDRCIYNGDPANQNAARVAGASYLLARTPKDSYNLQFGSYHPGVCQFVFCDGTVRAISVATDGTVLSLLSKRNDGQAVTLP
jgi:hypothetical protein